MESAPFGWSQVLWVGVSVESARSHWSQLLQLESAWSQVFWVGVSVESALSHWSQPLQLESAWSQQLRSLHAGASWSGMESAAPARSGSLRLAPQRSERSCVGAGFGVLVMWALSQRRVRRSGPQHKRSTVRHLVKTRSRFGMKEAPEACIHATSHE